ncbi:MAG: hypothetical protein J0H85_15985 [Sediminibacterium magnilacihabitans]|jgi:hypothetical protein|nr:hypothetical protein [Sediminibacterium magnilacihabitans]PQV58027.1 hypothetical protein CLV53_12412 [Sediminibacterium magnilacihabitans]
METYLIELTNISAYRLLQDLEDLKIIKVLKKEKEQVASKSRTARLRGTLMLNNKQYQDFQQHVKDIRNEWQENI